MSLNIPVPITDLERIGTLSPDTLFVVEKENVTCNLNWSSALSLLVNIPDTLTFGAGSDAFPSVAFFDSSAGFFAPQVGSVAVTTNSTRKFVVGPSGSIEFGEIGKEDTTRTKILSGSKSKCGVRLLEDIIVDGDWVVHGDFELSGSINFDDVTISGDGDGGDLTVRGGYVKFGTDCNQTLTVYNQTRNYCNVVSNENITITNDLNNHLSVFTTTIQTEDLIVTESSNFNTVTSTNTITVDDGGVVSLNNGGDLSTTGNVTANKIFGDGQDLTNLNLPSSLRLKGSIDPTVQGPGTPQHGDVWYSTTTGNFTSAWVGVEGQEIRTGQSFYYFATPTPKWVVGGIRDLQSPVFVLVDLDQTITAEKTHTSIIISSAGIDAGGQSILSRTLTLNDKAVSALTVSGDPTNTLTTKSYVDSRMANVTFDFPLITSKYIIGQSYNGSSAQTWDMDASPTGVDNLVRRNDEKDFTANIITASFLDGRSEYATSLDITGASDDSEYPMILTYSIGESELVSYSDIDFTYNPSSDTLTFDFLVADVEGSITGNVDTTTALQTPRTLWGQVFDGTEDVSGNITEAGTILSDTTNTRDIGSADQPYQNVYANFFRGRHEGTADIAFRLKERLTNGDHILGGGWNGAAITWSIDCDSDSSSGKIVVRNELGNFTSNVITANEFVGPLTGDVTGNVSGSSSSVTGNAATFTSLETPRTLWGESFDGTGNVSGDIDFVGSIVPESASTFDIGSSSLTYNTLYVDVLSGDFSNNATSTDRVNGPLGRGNYIEGTLTEWDGSESDTWSVDPRSENTPNKTVLRDVLGNFQAGTITSTLRGNITGDVTGNASGSSGFVTGNAATATRLQTTRSLWGQGFDGRQNVSGVFADMGSVIPEVTDTFTFGREDKKFGDVYTGTLHGYIQDNVASVDRLADSLSVGSYIEADSWDGSTDVYWNVFARSNNESNSIVLRDSSGNVIGSTITSNLTGFVDGDITGNVSGSSGSVTGNAATATKMETTREVTVTFTGTISGSGTLEYDGTSETNMTAQIETILADATIDGLTPLPE